MRRSLITSVGLFASIWLCAQENVGFLQGKIFDSQTHETLPGATVLYKKNRGTTTDANGIFSLQTELGSVSLTIQHIGYKTLTKILSLKRADTLFLEIGLEQQANEIEQVVVSASRVEQKISEITVSVNIIEPKGLSTNHITDVAELLNKSPGVEVLDGQASIRGGSGYSYGAGSRVLALIDGLPALSADAGNIKWQFLPLENISRIEIIKGASSVLYGSSALNGVINFRTADAKPNPQSYFHIETGIFDRPRQEKWVWWTTPRLFSNASAAHIQRFGNTDASLTAHVLVDNGYRRLNDEQLGRVSFKLKHSNSKIEGLTYGVNTSGGITRKTDFVLWENGEFGALRQNDSTAIEMVGTFLTIDPYISLRRGAKYAHDIRTRFQSSTNNFAEASHNNSHALSFYSEYQFWRKLGRIASLNLGVSQYSSRIESAFYGNHNGLNLAGYGQVELKPAKKLNLVAGLRFEKNWLDQSSSILVPLFRAGVNYQAKEFTFFRASFGQGYRYPSIAEKYASTTLGAVRIFQNPLLQAEKGWSGELGVKQGVKLNGSSEGLVDLALFYTQNKNLIEYVFGVYPEGLGFRAKNIEHSRVYGFEANFALNQTWGKLSNTISGGYLYTYPVEFDPRTNKNTDVFLKFRRKHSGNIGIASSFERYELGLNCYLKSKILSIDDVFLNPLTREGILPGFYAYWLDNNSGHVVMDANFSYKIDGRFTLSFVVKNFLNAEYMGRPGDIMPQRNYSLRLTGRL